MTPTDSLLFFCFADSIGSKVFCYTFVMFCEGVVCVYWGVLSYKYKYIYFALQKNNKKTNMRLMTVEECFFRCRLAVCSFSSALTLHNKRVRAHTHTRAHRFTRTRPFERSPVNRCRARIPTLGPRRCWVVTEKQSLFRICDTWSKGGTSFGTG